MAFHKRFSQEALTEEQQGAIAAALQVLVLDRRIRAFLTEQDPKALLQAITALNAAGFQAMSDVPSKMLCGARLSEAGRIVTQCTRPDGHVGPHNDTVRSWGD